MRTTKNIILLLPLLWLVCGVYCEQDQLTSTAITDCSGGYLPLQFINGSIVYDRYNNTMEFSFDVVAAVGGVIPVIAGCIIQINDQSYNSSFNFCVLDSTLCPMPPGDVNMKVEFPPDFVLPASVWDTPDLVATVTVTALSDFLDGRSYDTVLCVNATLMEVITTASSPNSTTSSPNPGYAAGSPESWTPYDPAKLRATSWITGVAAVALVAAGGAIGVLSSGTSAFHGASSVSAVHSAHSGVTGGWSGTGAPANGGGVPAALPPHSPASGGVSGGGKLIAAIIGGAVASKVATSGAAPNHASFGQEVGAKGASAHDPSAHDGLTAAQAHVGSSSSGPPASRMDPTALFFYFQSISTNGLLSLNYPPVYRAFTVNFAWANLILPISSFRRAAEHMRKCDLTLNPHEPFGIPLYAAKLGVSQQDILAIVYFVFLCACAILLGVNWLVHLVIHVNFLHPKNGGTKDVWLARRTRWQQMSSNNTLRLVSLGLGPLAVFGFNQWTQRCTSPVTAFISATAVLFTIGSLGFVTFLILRLTRRPGGIELLFDKHGVYAPRWGALYEVLHESKVFFVVPLLLVVIIRSAIVGFGRSGLSQVATLIVLESLLCIGLVKYRPFYSKGYNRVNYMLAGTRAITEVLHLPFVPQFNLKQSSMNHLGIFIVFVNVVVGAVIFGLTVLKLGWGVLWYRKKHIALESDKQQQRVLTRNMSSSTSGDINNDKD